MPDRDPTGADLGIPGVVEAQEIGRGGFGVVYRARQPALEREVAVKTLLGDDLGDVARERFLREARALGRLSHHPNIVTIYDVGVSEHGTPYLLMQYLPAGSLADRLQRVGRFPPHAVIAIGIKLAGALEAAHRAGITHRDVKPENVLLSDYDEPELADFGIARVSGSFKTTDTRVTASAHHAAPELFDGRPPSVRSDVYGLASTLYALLAGRPPFVSGPDEAMVALYVRIASASVPDLTAFGVPAPLWEVIRAALAKDPAARPATAAAFGSALQDAQRHLGTSITAMPVRAMPAGGGDEPPTTPTLPPASPPLAAIAGPTEATTASRLADAADALGPPTATTVALRRRRRVVPAATAAVVLVAVSAVLLALNDGGAGESGDPRRSGSSVAGLIGEPECAVLPADDPWNTDVSDLAVHPDSTTWIASIVGSLDETGEDLRLEPAFGREIGVPYNLVGEADGDVREVDVGFATDGLPEQSSPGPFPVPTDLETDGEGRAIVVDDRDCTLHEVFGPDAPDEPWTAAHTSASWDLVTGTPAADGLAATDQAGLPLFPSLARAAEVFEEGTIDHALRFSAPRVQNAFMAPATHAHGNRDNDDPALPPFGARLRLKEATDCSALSSTGKKLCIALKTYGMVLGDEGLKFSVIGSLDPRWEDPETLGDDLGGFAPEDFEFVDSGGLIVPGADG